MNHSGSLNRIGYGGSGSGSVQVHRSQSFGQETHEHVKTIKKRCLEAKYDLFHENTFKDKYVLVKFRTVLVPNLFFKIISR